MTDINLTVALTAHAETVIAGPTMASAESAIATAEAAGITVERLIGFDNATPECKAYFSAPAFDLWNSAEFNFRDQGKTRNELAKVAKGKWLAFLDGDDLFSENWLLEAVRRIQISGNEKTIVHPEVNWIFDAHGAVIVKPAQNDPLFTPYYFYMGNYYDALCLAPRTAWIEHPYADREISRGFAYEDWQWNIETMEAGWIHVVAKDTLIFKRRRDSSQTTESSKSKASIRNIDEIAIDRICYLNN